MEAISNSEHGDDKSGGPQGESLVKTPAESVFKACGQLRKQHWQ